MMRTSYRKKAYFPYIAFFVISAILPLMTAAPATAHDMSGPPGSGQRVTIQSHTIPAIVGKTPQGALARDTVLQLSIALTPQNTHGLDALVAAQKDHTSPLYHHFLTPAQFNTQFAPSQTAINAVVSYLQSQGLAVKNVASNHLIITASGTAAAIEQAFNVQIAQFVLGDRSVYAPTNDPSVPSALGNTIQGINGLDNVILPHILGRAKATGAPNFGTGPAGGFGPTDLRTAYDANPLLGWGFNGTGQTIGVFEQSNYNVNDVVHYRLHYGLGTPNISDTFVGGATPGTEALSGAIEDDLDLDAISDIAPGANLHVYIGNGDFQSFIAIWQQIITDDTAKEISTSWGDCEAHFSAAEIATLSTLFKQAAAQGQTIFAASGDEGPYDCMYLDKSISVDYPASDPNVVGVGGTTLATNNDYSYNHETVWSCAACGVPNYRPYGLASGGGYSQLFSRPSYQTGNGVNTSGSRQVPDVAANADPATGYSVYCTTVQSYNCYGWGYEGGTSGAAPLWTGIAADIDQYVASLGNPTVIIDNALLYTLFNTPQNAPAYHDVTVGNNLYYNAGPGYDLATGIGTPDVWNLAQDMARQTYTKFTSPDKSPTQLSMATLNGTLYVAWTGAGNNNINIMHSTDGGHTLDSTTKYTSPEKSALPVSLVAFNNTLYIAWVGIGDNSINLMHSTDGGHTLDSATKYTSSERSTVPISLVAFNSSLYLTWSGAGNHFLNLMHSTDGGQTFDSTTKYIDYNNTTPNTPVMVGIGTTLYLAWTGSGNNFINLMRSTDVGLTLNDGTKYVDFNTSPIAVSLADHNGALYIAWTGSSNGYINYMHSTDGNSTFNDGTKSLLLSETSPLPLTLTFNGSLMEIAWVGVGNYNINLLSRILN